MKIAFGYKMGSGKSIACSYLMSKYHGNKFAFADPIYDILNYSQTVANIKHEKDRQFLQFIGTEWGRNKDKDIWVNILLKKSSIINSNCFNDDVRFINEFEALKENGWVCVKINRENREIKGDTNHSSETSLDIIHDKRWDYIIDNNGTLEEFYNKLDNIVLDINESRLD